MLPGNSRDYTVLKRSDETSTGRYGYDPDKRPISMLLASSYVNLDKPPGPTSHEASEYVKRILKQRKAGHSGTLDPKVTGVLPTGVGKATKLNELMLSVGKEYVGIMHLHNFIADPLLEAAVAKYTGKIRQLPPVKSAVRREPRTRTVYYFEILERDRNAVLFRVGVEAGTYIRKLIHDLGSYVSVGAHMGDLRRTRSGPFREEDAVILQDLREAYTLYEKEGDESMLRSYLLPPERAIVHVPKMYVSDYAVASLTHGSYLAIPGVIRIDSDIKAGMRVALMSLRGEIIGYGNARMDAEAMLVAESGIAATPDAILMEQGSYPTRGGSA